MKESQERMVGMMKANRERKAYPERMETNQEKTEAKVEHYNWAPCIISLFCNARLLRFYMMSLEE